MCVQTRRGRIRRMMRRGMRKKKEFVPRKDKRKGSENRQPTGSRERNVGHPDGEEHSIKPKGNRGVRHSEM